MRREIVEQTGADGNCKPKPYPGQKRSTKKLMSGFLQLACYLSLFWASSVKVCLIVKPCLFIHSLFIKQTLTCIITNSSDSCQ